MLPLFLGEVERLFGPAREQAQPGVRPSHFGCRRALPILGDDEGGGKAEGYGEREEISVHARTFTPGHMNAR